MRPQLPPENPDVLREAMRRQWLAPDRDALEPLYPLADLGDDARGQAQDYARRLIAGLRAEQRGKRGVDALLNEFSLSTEEGRALMALAEALLRVPDARTADDLIRDKLQAGNWNAHLGRSQSTFVNAASRALVCARSLVDCSDEHQRDTHAAWLRAAGRMAQPLMRTAMRRAMARMGEVFVMGRSIDEALRRARPLEAGGWRYSYDMLGEGARTAAVARACFEAYAAAIDAIGAAHRGKGPEQAAGISVKLSALHPRYEYPQRERVLRELVPLLRQLALKARDHGIGLTVDAEEAARLDLSLDIIERVFADPALAGWDGFGVAVQAYQKRAPQVIDWLAQLAQRTGRRMMVRLVKGAYWDAEIKHAQVHGLDGYPVYTRKAATDVCYQACARKLLDRRDVFYPQFATHNAWTVAAILAMDERRDGYEFQRLHGMGDALYEQVMLDHAVPCRVYAPVGAHRDLLAYLVRRLLENGANSSFVNNIVDERIPVEQLVADPLLTVRRATQVHHPAIPLPRALYGSARTNSRGLDTSDVAGLAELSDALAGVESPAVTLDRAAQLVRNPADPDDIVGAIDYDTPDAMLEKLARAQRASAAPTPWAPAARASFLLRLADALEADRAGLVHLCQREAGKTLDDAIAEVREAADFCRYYAAQLQKLPPASALGVVLCISPWNFPLAIFLGQVTGALAAGNVVLAKPAEQTSLIALRALALMHACGLPTDQVQCVLGRGAAIGPVLVPDPRIRGVLFTGSTRTGRWLFDTLARRDDAPIPLIAETGGQNAMIVDSTALPEQVVDDVVRSGFRSAGQRCSALRVLCLQADIADTVIEMLGGAMDELVVGDPAALQTDVGPVIDVAAEQRLLEHVERMQRLPGVQLLHTSPLSTTRRAGHFFAPRLYEISRIDQLPDEVFGPVVHVLRYHAAERTALVDQINALGYGLTMGIHSRIQRTADAIAARARVGNIYINRDMVGAVVGVQPFGGCGLSGTGPKAGGPLYLPRLVHAPAGADTAHADPVAHELPGPTGETNRYLWMPRGRVWAAYDDADALANCLATVDAALRSGNRLSIELPPAWREPVLAHAAQVTTDPAMIRVLEAGIETDIADAEVYVIAPGHRRRPWLLQSLAGREGRLPLVIADPSAAGDWRHFVAEKTITTNTTAAGGNASLLTAV